MPGKNRWLCLALAAGWVWLALGCGHPAPATKALPVFVSLLPQAYFVERIGAEQVQVEVLVMPGKSPEDYEPTPQQMLRLAQARIYFRIGMPFETALVPKITKLMPQLRLVDTSQGIPLRVMERSLPLVRAGADTISSRSVPSGSQAERGFDPHSWLNPLLVKQQSQTIYAALVEIDPEGRSTYAKNLALWLHDLEQLQQELKVQLAPLKGRTLYVFHPAYGYFTDAYGLKQAAVEIEGKEPSGQDLAEYIHTAQVQQIKVIFVQPEFSTKSVEAIAQAIHGQVVTLDPLAKDYLPNMRYMATEIKKALEK